MGGISLPASQSCVAVIHPQQDRAFCPSSPCMVWDCDTHQTHGWEQAGCPPPCPCAAWVQGTHQTQRWEQEWVSEDLWVLQSHHCALTSSTASAV